MSGDQDNEFRSELEASIVGFELEPLSEQQATKLVDHYAMLRRWNQRINLTRIIRPADAATLHYAESLLGARFIVEATVLDIGSGAGFPAVPIAVARPDVQVTAVEADQKKALFLKEVKEQLRLANFNVVNARLEEFEWATYQLLTSRALERAEAVFPSVIERMSLKQRLMLYCAPDLVARLEGKLNVKCDVETHLMPLSRGRIVAIFRR